MKKKGQSIYWCLNIVLLFLMCCKLSPISNHFMSLVTSNIIINYLIIIFNILICKYAYDEIKKEQSKLDVGIIINCSISVIFICLVMVDYSISWKYSVLQIILVICSYLLCYFFTIKYGARSHMIIVLTAILFVIMVIGEIQFSSAAEQCNKKKTYNFVNSDVYYQYKKLYENFEEVPPYAVLDYTDDSVYAQDLTTGKTEYFAFKTVSEQKQFINEHTMGIDVNIPCLGTDIEFYDNENKILYRSADSKMNEIDEMKKVTGFYFTIVMGLLIVISLAGGLYEKNKKNID